ncbi:hypothetical protein RHS01_03349 [Rhizoctonia solani]|uniref:C3H1-type domain-containing protein n=1 Tax=Rhizoctonia solani TaxID=456999 RepID=A0A8H7IJE5_9AGAM|nr:hypothetical protein RHS01_03349 [Rhizoctonia solani]
MDDAGDKYGHIRAYLAVLQREHNSKSPTGDSDGPEASNAGLAAKIASLLAEEKEDEVKSLLAEKLSIPEPSVRHMFQYNCFPVALGLTVAFRFQPDLDAYVLEFMHKHKDDIDGISLVSLATPTRRPLSRASSTSFRLPRPDTPSASGSPLSTSFRRPHTPASVTSPLAANLQAYALGNSPSASPTLGHATTHAFPGVIGGLSGSRPASPLPSPRHLNAKALEFRPGMLSRQASAMSGSLHRDTPSPDVWGHGSPHKGTSNLAIAAPLVPSDSFYPRPLTPGSSLGSSFPSSAPSAIPTQPGVSSSLSPPGIGPSPLSSDSPVPSAAVPVPTSGVLGNRPRHNSFDDEDEFSPFDALSQAGWEFDNAVALLMERTKPGSKAIQVKAPPVTGQTPSQVTRSSGVAVVPRETFVQTRGATKGQAVAGKATTNSGSTAANRVCRYYLAGECRRADCRFSHDIERALCRFWLRSQCAKGEHCEFLHTLPQESDVSGIVNSMARTDLGPVDAPVEEPPLRISRCLVGLPALLPNTIQGDLALQVL